MMIIVPAFAEGQQRHPPAVGRSVCGVVVAVANHVARAIDKKGTVKAHNNADKNTPHHKRHPAQGIKQETKRYL